MQVDLVVIGGGVNGTGIANDAAGRGLSVLLCEQTDLAAATSSNSSKLIHGGLRYLEHYEFRLVREALAEREVLLKNAPHIMWPLTFRLPHQAHLRPVWMIRLGLFLYDHLAKREKLHGSRKIIFGADSPLEAAIKVGFEYADGWVDDSRLVVLNAMAAKTRGAQIYTHTRCIKATRQDTHWLVTLRNERSGQHFTVQSKAIVNAAGPWVSQLFDETFTENSPQHIRLVKGSHIVVPRLHEHPHAYILQNADKRIVFVIPYEEKFSLIGTTDVEYTGDPRAVAISEEETTYLLAIANQYFKHKITAADVVHSYSGVRPLLDDESDSAQSVTRDYKLEVSAEQNSLPLVSVFGGKITTYRKLAEAAVDKLQPYFATLGPRWTASQCLPGGDFDTIAQLSTQLQHCYPWLTVALCERFARTYGNLSHRFLQHKTQLSDLGIAFSADLWQAEVDYLRAEEWATTAEDILWRRTKLGLTTTPTEVAKLNAYLMEQAAPETLSVPTNTQSQSPDSVAMSVL
ncbi:glycerol-3-phosphate dehydrogenase [Alishewanella tabrizica]|uniref:Glycerol-3-phosphate dehydrogenase n=1 Tax=Alishewanella tabrizica TaxID=671278 RepID=A0ABQ2WLG7_9ALTE|nr:glycerol-3-phosphate dehydrogenase [Alishewanella tabrizica]GGW61259.1 glycerol-3-phosphate dehydrogenase [Alishewanella tabrizica]